MAVLLVVLTTRLDTHSAETSPTVGGPAGALAERFAQRAALDRHAGRAYAVEGATNVAVLRPSARQQLPAEAVPIVRVQLPAKVEAYRAANALPVKPLPGFRAPILDRASELEFAPAVAPADPRLRAASDLVRAELMGKGLLAAARQAIGRLGPERFLTNAPAGVSELQSVGLPVDLLGFFAPAEVTDQLAEFVVTRLASALVAGRPPAEMDAELRGWRFLPRPSQPGFRVATETGEWDIRWVRVQLGGGYSRGVVRGGAIDIVGQLLAALPEAEFLVTVPEDLVENIHWLARHAWPVRRASRVTLVVEPRPITAWAQDNGKAGTLAGSGIRATLTPRYASQGEGELEFHPGDSYLMDGLRAAGQTVIHSSLLFQGGNLLVFTEPGQGQRVALLADTEIQRNVALGLSPEDVLALFRAELGVDRCEVLPGVSYHLDYDVSLRVTNGAPVAFVNDPDAAARIIVECGLRALASAGVLTPAESGRADTQLKAGQTGPLTQWLRPRLARERNRSGAYPASLANRFSAAPTDHPAFNFQCFLGALDWLAAGASIAPPDDEGLTALRSMAAGLRAQRERLGELGLRLVPVPSLPDLYAGLNHLNGLQDRTRFLMPSAGGFYTALDDAAAAAWSAELGVGIRLVRIQCAEIQRLHGAVHCVAAAYP